MLTKKYEIVNMLADICVVQKIRQKKMICNSTPHILDEQYASLGCSMKPLNSNSKTYAMNWNGIDPQLHLFLFLFYPIPYVCMHVLHRIYVCCATGSRRFEAIVRAIQNTANPVAQYKGNLCGFRTGKVLLCDIVLDRKHIESRFSCTFKECARSVWNFWARPATRKRALQAARPWW